MYFNSFLKKNTHKLYIFCLWIWILSALYLLNITTFSTLLLCLISLIFTILRQIFSKFNKINHSVNYFIIIFETIVFLSIYYKHVIIDKKNLINYENILYSFFIFLLYLLFLKLTINKSFYEYYFKILKH